MRKSRAEQRAQNQFKSEARAQAFYDSQMCEELNEHMCDFVGRQDMVFIATSDHQGSPDCSFRAGLPGFVKVLDNRTLCFPEYRGNGVMASVGNIMENPKIGMIFLDFYKSTVGLHVNGRARVMSSQDLRGMPNIPQTLVDSTQKGKGRCPECWIVVDVEEAYIHCSKHVPLLKKLPKRRQWGTGDIRHKGGDFFQVESKKKTKVP